MGGCNILWSSLHLIGVAGLNDGPDTGHLSEYGGRDDEDAAPREHDTAVLENYLRQKFEKAKFETEKLRNHYPPPLCSQSVAAQNRPIEILLVTVNPGGEAKASE